MGLIENPKTYTGRDLETIFFRPMLTGDNAEQIGIRVLYNMPVPTTIQMWSPAGDILKPYSSGWTGGDSATRKQKTITMQKIKAETGYSASDYFSQVYELITGRPDVNMDDLSGTELEKAETEMFRAAIAESLRATMWVGDMADTASPLNKFDGFMALIRNYNAFMDFPMVDFTERQLTSETVVDLLDEMWRTAPPILKSMKGEAISHTSSPRTSSIATSDISTEWVPTAPTTTSHRDAARSLTTAYRWSTSTYRSICPRHSSTHRSACSQTGAT